MKLYKIIMVLLVCISCKNENSNKEDIPDTITIYTIGDSTMANKLNPEENPERGWGQILPQFFNDQVIIKNYAVNGRSTRSYINEKRWDSVYNQLKKGDYVFVQFGHNDQKGQDPKRYTNPMTDYRTNLIRFVEESKSKGAIPILFTSIVRRSFNEEGGMIDTHGDYPQQVKMIAKEYNVPLIDLQHETELLEVSYGIEGSKKLHLHFAPNENPYYPEGKEDDTHLSLLGAREVAQLAIKGLKKEVPKMNDYIKKN